MRISDWSSDVCSSDLLFFGPISDAIGRKLAILIGLALFGGGVVVAMPADSLAQVLVGRVIQGIGCAGPKIASRALIREQYEDVPMAPLLRSEESGSGKCVSVRDGLGGARIIKK